MPGFGRFARCESDGNKRLAWAAAVTFLALSGHPVRDLDVGAAEAFMISVASGKLAGTLREIDGYYAISMLCRWNDAPHRNRPPPRLPAAAQEGSLAQAIAAAYDLELQLSTRRTTTSSTSLMPRTPTVLQPRPQRPDLPRRRSPSWSTHRLTGGRRSALHGLVP